MAKSAVRGPRWSSRKRTGKGTGGDPCLEHRLDYSAPSSDPARQTLAERCVAADVDDAIAEADYPNMTRATPGTGTMAHTDQGRPHATKPGTNDR